MIGLATGVISNVGQSGSMARDGEDVIVVATHCFAVMRLAGFFFDVFQVARRSHRHSQVWLTTCRDGSCRNHL